MLKKETIKLLSMEDDLLEKMYIITYEIFKEEKNSKGESYLEELYTQCNEKNTYIDKIVFLATTLIKQNKITRRNLLGIGFDEELIKKIKEQIFKSNKNIKIYQIKRRITK